MRLKQTHQPAGRQILSGFSLLFSPIFKFKCEKNCRLFQREMQIGNSVVACAGEYELSVELPSRKIYLYEIKRQSGLHKFSFNVIQSI
jgi:hypothetical protein